MFPQYPAYSKNQWWHRLFKVCLWLLVIISIIFVFKTAPNKLPRITEFKLSIEKNYEKYVGSEEYLNRCDGYPYKIFVEQRLPDYEIAERIQQTLNLSLVDIVSDCQKKRINELEKLLQRPDVIQAIESGQTTAKDVAAAYAKTSATVFGPDERSICNTATLLMIKMMKLPPDDDVIRKIEDGSTDIADVKTIKEKYELYTNSDVYFYNGNPAIACINYVASKPSAEFIEIKVREKKLYFKFLFTFLYHVSLAMLAGCITYFLIRIFYVKILLYVIHGNKKTQ